ncbi:hypothetical protein [Lacticaseibacillus camelliae]|uniref:hypothetical protein n=1 Tax=Lacticaseibacillus camelliae TaxID=381742 RepID=UPI00138F3FC3
MFSYEKLQTLNDIETAIYNYVIKHEAAVETMPIRELAKHAHVSTASVLRFAEKNGLRRLCRTALCAEAGS